jgi:hypothetical protein
LVGSSPTFVAVLQDVGSKSRFEGISFAENDKQLGVSRFVERTLGQSLSKTPK